MSAIPKSLAVETAIPAAQRELLQFLAEGLPEDRYFLVARKVTPGDGRAVFPAHAWTGGKLVGPWYFSCGGGSDPKRRTRELVTHVRCIVIDDVGTKVEASRLPPPTWRLETSPGNFQWGYAFDRWLDDLDGHDALNQALVAEGLQDPGAQGVNRLSRVPGSLNDKATLREPWEAVLREFEPSRTWGSVEALAAEFGLETQREPRGEQAHSEPMADPTGHPMMVWLAGRGMLHGRKTDGWWEIRCPFAAEHSDGRDDTAFLPKSGGAFGVRCFHSHGEDQGAYRARFVAWAEAEGAPVEIQFSEATREALRRFKEQMPALAGVPEPEPVRALPVRSPEPIELDWDNWNDNPEPVRFLIPGWLPDGVVTLFAAHGGTGKSYISLFIALALATGRNPFDLHGERLERVKVLLYSAEDDKQVLQFRLNRYMQMLGIRPEALKGWLKVLDATKSNNVLFTAGRDVGARTTARLEWLREQVEGFEAGLLIFDNASDAFDGNENERAAVRQFLTALKSVAPATLLLAHVDAVSSMADADKAKGYSGSTGWHNSARSRWFMSRGGEDDTIRLQVPKSNYARAGAEASIAWDNTWSLFKVLEVTHERPTARGSRSELLGLLQQVLDSGQNVSPSPQARNGLFASLSPLAGFPRGLKSKDVQGELRRWLVEGLVQIEEYEKAARNGTAERLRLTEYGRDVAAGDA